MSGMAEEMAARIEADEARAAEPGTGREGETVTPPAEAITTDTRDGEPGPVPYSRFKEVNDRYTELRGYETLREYGYDPDSLGRLAQFEASYVQDPHGTVAQLVDNLDLPDDAKSAIKERLGGASADDGGAGGGTPSTPTDEPKADEPPPWAKPLVEDYDSRQQEKTDQERQQMLDKTLDHWNELDEKAGIRTPEGIKLSLIASHASRGYQTLEALAEGARQDAVQFRETVLGSAVQPGSRTTGPRSLPGPAATASEPQDFGGDIHKATKAAMAAIERGELPSLGG